MNNEEVKYALSFLGLDEHNLDIDKINDAYNKCAKRNAGREYILNKLDLAKDILINYVYDNENNIINDLTNPLHEISSSIDVVRENIDNTNKEDLNILLTSIKNNIHDFQSNLDNLMKSIASIKAEADLLVLDVASLEKYQNTLQNKEEELLKVEEQVNIDTQIKELNNKKNQLIAQSEKVYNDMRINLTAEKFDELKKVYENLSSEIKDIDAEITKLKELKDDSVLNNHTLNDFTKSLEDNVKTENLIPQDDLLTSYKEIDNKEDNLLNIQPISNSHKINNEDVKLDNILDFANQNVVDNSNIVTEEEQQENTIDEQPILEEQVPQIDESQLNVVNPMDEIIRLNEEPVNEKNSEMSNEEIDDLEQKIISNTEAMTNENNNEMTNKKEIDLIDISRPKPSGVQVTKNFANDIKTNKVGRKLEKNTYKIEKKPVGFLGKLREKIKTNKINKEIKKNIQMLNKKYKDVYLAYLNIEKLKELESATIDEQEKSRYTKLISKLLHDKKGEIDYLNYVANELDNYDSIYNNIKDDMEYQSIINLPNELDNFNLEDLERNLEEISSDYSEADATSLYELANKIKDLKINGRVR